MRRPTALMTALLLGGSLAAPKISPQSIIVNPVVSSLTVKTWVDRDPSGHGTPVYRVRDKIRIYTSVSEDAYVYLFNVDPQGHIDQILPNRLGGSNFLKGGTVKVFPGPGDNFTYDISAPYGLNKVLALASQTPLNLSQLSSFTAGNPLAQVNVQGQQRLAQALSIVVKPIEPSSWVTFAVQYNVGY